MLVYIAFFVFIMILAIDYEFNRKLNTGLLALTAMLLALLAGLRHPDIERDYQSYLYGFEFIWLDRNPLHLAIYEPGFFLIVYAVRNLMSINYGIIIMLVYAFSSVFIKSLSIRTLAVNPFLVLLFYYSHFFFLHEMTQVRVGLATAIFFIGLINYLRNERRNFVLMVLLATFFHYSAILYLGVLLLRTDRLQRYVYAALLFCSVALAFVKLPLMGYLSGIESNEFSTKLENYTVAAEFAVEKVNVLNAVTIINMLCCLYLLIAVAKGGFEKDPQLTLFLKCNIISVFLLSFFSAIPSVAFRVSDLYAVLSMFTFASLARYGPLGKYNIFVTILLAAVFFYFFAINSTLVKPYKMVGFQ
jgi:hypothetical protein